MDQLVFGQRLRHLRRAAGLTLEALGDRVDKPAPYLSMVETGKREPRLTLITALAEALDVPLAELLSANPPTRRAELEISLERSQQEPLYRGMGLPHLKPSAKLPDEALEHIVGLYDELKSRLRATIATPEEARKANVQLQEVATERGNHHPDIEAAAGKALSAVGYDGSAALSQRDLLDIAGHFGFEIHQVRDFPTAVRSVADQRNGRIYIPQRNELRTRAARSVVLRTLGHFALGHSDPFSYSDFLRQRMEAAYFASAVLVPETPAAAFLNAAKNDRDLSVEDLKERFYVSYEMAAHRFTNLATSHLGLAVHMVRSDEDGIIWKAYANNGVPFPTDADGAIEGQRLCRQWGTRMAFRSDD
ncbi:MAG: helix-turn-helix domain-containing protein, partial [Acidimicrobiia bacterium]|nr:helix-turn-helix domain-containing protein [Acidimicrobiia bacterium]